MAAAEASRSSAPAANQEPIQPIAQPVAQPQNASQPYAQYPGAYGQPFQSYHQYQPAVGVTPQQLAPPPVVEKKSWIYTRAALHAIGVVCGIIDIALSFSISGNGMYKFLAWFTTPVPFIALVWSLTELIIRYTRKFQSGIHPGAHVAVCLILWLAASIIGGMHTTYAVITGQEHDDDYYCSGATWNSDTQDYDYSDCRSPYGHYPQFIALSVFAWIIWVVYFILFVFACVDTHKRNTAARQPIMIVQPGSYWPQPNQGWQQLPPGAVAAASGQQDIPLQNRSAGQDNNANEKGKQTEYYG